MRFFLERPDNYPDCDVPSGTLPLIAEHFIRRYGCQSGPCVYLVRCKAPRHWYVGYTTNPQRRLCQHFFATDATSDFLKKYKFDKVVDRYTAPNRQFAQYLEGVVYRVLTQVYPDFCFSMGRMCGCDVGGVHEFGTN